MVEKVAVALHRVAMPDLPDRATVGSNQVVSHLNVPTLFPDGDVEPCLARK